MAVTWGSTVGGYGRIGLCINVTTNDSTTYAGNVEVWFWSKWSVYDDKNKLYYDDLAEAAEEGSATTLSERDLVIQTTSDSGKDGWYTANQIKIADYTFSYTKGTSAATRYIYAKLANIDVVGGTMYANTTLPIPAKTTYTNSIYHYKQVGINADGSTKWERADTTTFTAMYGETVTIPNSHVQTYTGFHSSGSAGSYWGTETWSGKTIGSTFTQPAGAVSIEYYYPRDTYDILYNANGGSGAPEKQTKLYDMNLTLSPIIPTKSGYTFMGWGTSATDTSADYSAEGVYTSNSPITLYAVWRASVSLAYDANGGTGAPTTVNDYIYNATTNKKFTVSSTKPTKTGYTFLGWSTSSTATTPSYVSGDTVTVNAGRAVFLYAIWKKTLTLSYDANGGSGAPSNQSADIYNATTSKVFTISTTAPTRTGYKFLGWSTSSTATSATYSAGDNITLSQNTKLYAVWEILGTLRIKQKGVWKIGIVWIKNNDGWKRGVPYIKVNSGWKRGL